MSRAMPWSRTTPTTVLRFAMPALHSPECSWSKILGHSAAFGASVPRHTYVRSVGLLVTPTQTFAHTHAHTHTHTPHTIEVSHSHWPTVIAAVLMMVAIDTHTNSSTRFFWRPRLRCAPRLRTFVRSKACSVCAYALQTNQSRHHRTK